jgi:hypothetical protein
VKSINLLLFLVLVSIVPGGCSAPKAKTSHVLKKEMGRELVHDRVKIKAYGSYEECIELRPGQVSDYEFDASDFVNFNIHYHTESGIEYPVDKRGVTFGKGTLDPSGHKFFSSEQENYCLMWENLNDGPAEVTFKCVLRKK